MPTTPPSGRTPTPPPSRRSGRQQRLANREANRSLSRASTRGGGGGGGGILLWTAIAVVIGIVAIGAAFLVSQNGKKTDNTDLTKITTPTVLTPSDIASSGLTLGDANAPVKIDLYGDFRCTGCYAFAIDPDSTGQSTEARLVDAYVKTHKAKLTWHDYLIIDLNQGNNASRDAANAARCAADQGKFWLMHDWLYANQSPSETPDAFSKDRLKAIGAKVPGLDTAKFNACVDAGTHNADVAADVPPSGVTSTPTVVVNGKVVSGLSFDVIAAAIDNPSGSPSPAASASVAPTATPVPSVSVAPSASPSVKPS